MKPTPLTPPADVEGNKNNITKEWIVTFAYSGSNKREFFDQEFSVPELGSIDLMIIDYVRSQNKGEAKSDRIRFWSKRKKLKP